MAIIDRAHLDAQTSGDRDLARELLALFADQCRRVLPGLSDGALPASERADLAHTLKGSAASVGAREVWTLCAEYEASLREAGEAGKASEGTAALDALAPAIDAVLAEIAAFA